MTNDSKLKIKQKLQKTKEKIILIAQETEGILSWSAIWMPILLPSRLSRLFSIRIRPPFCPDPHDCQQCSSHLHNSLTQGKVDIALLEKPCSFGLTNVSYFRPLCNRVGDPGNFWPQSNSCVLTSAGVIFLAGSSLFFSARMQAAIPETYGAAKAHQHVSSDKLSLWNRCVLQKEVPSYVPSTKSCLGITVPGAHSSTAG